MQNPSGRARPRRWAKAFSALAVGALALVPLGGSAGAVPDGTLEWATNFAGSAPGGYVADLFTDASGNVFVAGAFALTTDFDRGPGVASVTPNARDAFVAKYTPAGDFVWVKTFTGAGDQYANGVALDSAGNVVVGLNFDTDFDSDPGPGTVTTATMGGMDAAVVKLTAAGDFVWADSWGGGGYDALTRIAVDSLDQVYVTGIVWPTLDLDPGPGTSTISTLANGTSWMAKLDPSGGFMWGHDLPLNAGDNGYGRDIAIDSAQNVYMVGFFTGTTDLDPGPGVASFTSAGGVDTFLVKYDAAGNYLWARQLGGAGRDELRRVLVDSSGSIFIGGHLTGPLDVDPGPGVQMMAGHGGSDGVVAKLDSSGNLIWASGVGGSLDDSLMSLAVDRWGSVYIAGGFQGTADFDPGAGTVSSTSAGSGDAYVVRLSSTGVYEWHTTLGSTGGDTSRALTTDVNGDVVIGGTFAGTVDFDPGVGVTSFASLGTDGFVTKFGGRTPPPTLVSAAGSPTYTAGGNSVVLTGTNFVGVTSVTVGGVAVSGFTVDSGTQITVTMPAGVVGPADVVVSTVTGSATLAGGVAYVAPQTQTLGVTAPGSVLLSSQTLVLPANASSGLPITYVSLSPAVCTVSGSTVTLLSAGTCELTAGQAGSTEFASIAPVNVSFPVVGVTVPVTSQSATSQSVTVDVPAGGSVHLIDGNGVVVDTVTVPNVGVFTLDAATGVITFAPIDGFSGDATVLFEVVDALGNTARATYTASVLGAVAENTTTTTTPVSTPSNLAFTGANGWIILMLGTILLTSGLAGVGLRRRTRH